jgi:hypothetical protein
MARLRLRPGALIEVEVQDGFGLDLLVEVKAGIAVESDTCWGGQRAGERGGAVVGSPKWMMTASTLGSGGEGEMSAPQRAQVRG